jgi:hypothetical protein
MPTGRPARHQPMSSVSTSRMGPPRRALAESLLSRLLSGNHHPVANYAPRRPS